MDALDTPRLWLRELLESDLEPFFELGSDPQVTRWQDYILVNTPGQAAGWIGRAVRQNRELPRRAYHLAILRKEDGAWLGYLGFGIEGDPARAEFEFGYALHRRYWGQGYAAEALQRVLEFCFRHLGAQKVFGDCDEANPASARVMQKAGLRFERAFEELNETTQESSPVRRFSILKEDWEKNSP